MPLFERPSAIGAGIQCSRGGEPGDRLVAGPAAGQLGHDLGVHHRAAPGHGADRVDELVIAEHPVLEQVADPARLVSEQLTSVELLDALGEHDHWEARYRPPRRQRRLQPTVGERRRQPDVDDRDVGPLFQ